VNDLVIPDEPEQEAGDPPIDLGAGGDTGNNVSER